MFGADFVAVLLDPDKPKLRFVHRIVCRPDALQAVGRRDHLDIELASNTLDRSPCGGHGRVVEFGFDFVNLLHPTTGTCDAQEEYGQPENSTAQRGQRNQLEKADVTEDDGLATCHADFDPSNSGLNEAQGFEQESAEMHLVVRASLPHDA